MGKNDFDIDFDFDEEYGFDPKAFLGTEDYDDNIDLNAFSDEDLGLTSQAEAQEDAPASEDDDTGSAFDLNDDLDLDEFLNMSMEEPVEEPEEEAQWEDEPEASDEEEAEYAEEAYSAEEADSEEEYDEEEEYEAEEEPSEDAEDEVTDWAEETEYDEEAAESDEADFEDEPIQEDDMSEQETKRKPRQRKERKPFKLPKLPKLKTPNIFTKFYDLYFAPVLHKELREEPQDPSNPRRRKKSKQQVFKEVYLPPIIACVCLILVLSFVIGSLSNFIAQRQINKANEQSRLDASASAAELAEQENQRIVEEAAELAAGYDYDAAITKLETIGDLTQYPDIAAKRSEYDTARSALVEYKDPTMIPNLSFHVLIEDMARALKDTEYGGSYNKNFVTTAEFTKILNQLYANGYVLVDFNSFAGSNTGVDGNEQFFVKSLWLPADKKPVMITETMVNYFAYMIDGNDDKLADANGDGFASRLVVDGNGDIKAEYIDANGQTLVGNYDLVPILEDFIAEHPDFCYRGARAILAVTGHEGVFGYRCNTSYIATQGQAYYDNEVAGAKEITQALRDKGYTIACYTYANEAYANKSVANIQADLTSWTSQIVSVIGEVDTFVFAKNSNITDYNGNAFTVMYSSGFRYFISNSTSPYTEVNSKYVRQNRLLVTGQNMQHYASQFNGLFDPNAVLDLSIRGNVPN